MMYSICKQFHLHQAGFLHYVTLTLSIPGRPGIKGAPGRGPFGPPGFTGHKGDKGRAGLPGVYICAIKDVNGYRCGSQPDMYDDNNRNVLLCLSTCSHFFGPVGVVAKLSREHRSHYMCVGGKPVRDLVGKHVLCSRSKGFCR